MSCLRLALRLAVTFLVVVRSAPLAAGTSEAPRIEVDERPRPPADRNRLTPSLRPDRDRTAWCEKRADGLFRLVVDGIPNGPPSEEAHQAVFSPDGTHVAWSALRGGRRVLVLDGRERGPLDGLLLEKGPFGLSPSLKVADDGKTVAWIACSGKPRRCTGQIFEREPGPSFDEISSLWLSSGPSPRLACLGRRGEAWSLLVDGRETLLPSKRSFTDPASWLPPIEGFRFSPDGKHDAFVGRATLAPAGRKAISDGKEVPLVFPDWPAVFVDGKPQEPVGIEPFHTQALGLPVFSPDGTRIAWVVVGASLKEGFFSGKEVTFSSAVVVDGKGSRSWSGDTWKGGSRSEECPDATSRAVSKTVVPAILSEILPCWAGVSDPVFSPDGRRVAWTARTGAKSYVVIRDGEAAAGPAMATVFGLPVFSSAGRLAWAGRGNGEVFVAIDGEVVYREPDRPQSFVHALTFSPDGAHLAFFTGTGEVFGKSPRRLVLDGVAGPIETIGPPVYQLGSLLLVGPGEASTPSKPMTFSDDGAHLAWIRNVPVGKADFSVVLDGRAGPTYTFVDPVSLRFGPDGRVSYRATRGTQSFDVTQPAAAWPAPSP